MASRFQALLDILEEAFRVPVSVEDYFKIGQCIRLYSSQRMSHDVEQLELARKGWTNYHPCDRMDTLRFGLVFVDSDNPRVNDLVAVFRAAL